MPPEMLVSLTVYALYILPVVLGFSVLAAIADLIERILK